MPSPRLLAPPVPPIRPPRRLSSVPAAAFAHSLALLSTAFRPRLSHPSLDHCHSLPPRHRRPASTAAARCTMSTSNSAPAPSTEAYQGEILCNRALNMNKIKAVGFDMDYTLAMYYGDTFEKLSAECALKKLVHNLNYPPQLLSLKYDHSSFIRGLVIDKRLGNILKLDRHKYVKRAVHGTTVLSKEKRSEMYDDLSTGSSNGFVEPRFTVLDAMFSLPDAFLFSNLVDFKDRFPDAIPQTYDEVYRDVRRSVDMCHRDGSIKDEVALHPERFIQLDLRLMDTLRKIKASGRKVFLLTNSLWDYTDHVMNFLYAADPSNKGSSQKWTELFDVVITGSCKPAFLLDARRPIYRCSPVDGTLTNTEGVQYGESVEDYLAHGTCFHGGNYTHLHELLHIRRGNEILYVGDHIYSDVLKSKRTLGWRTMLVIPELRDEINALYHVDNAALFDDISMLNDARDEMDEHIDRLERDDLTNERAAELVSIKEERDNLIAKINDKVDQYHRKFHPTWGQLLKTGLQNSRFAEQVESYACLYTSKVSNMHMISTDMHWRAMNDLMPHDRLTTTPMHRVLAKRATVEGDEKAAQHISVNGAKENSQ